MNRKYMGYLGIFLSACGISFAIITNNRILTIPFSIAKAFSIGYTFHVSRQSKLKVQKE